MPRFQNELQDVVSSIAFVDDYLLSYLATIALGIYTTTVAHLNENYYLSEDRAVKLALNESNSINNYEDTKDAQKQGYTHKKWVAQLDERTRLEHIMMDGTVVPIGGYFEFSDCKMFAPHDVVNGTFNQVANCRCSLEYLVKNDIHSGAIDGEGIYERWVREEKEATQMYSNILKNRDNEISLVANASGYSEDDIGKIYDHVFVRNHLFEDGTIHKFDVDYEMAMSWERIKQNQALEHDKILLRHELEEEKIMGESLEITYQEAHNRVTEMGHDYDYKKAVEEYLERQGK